MTARGGAGIVAGHMIGASIFLAVALASAVAEPATSDEGGEADVAGAAEPASDEPASGEPASGEPASAVNEGSAPVAANAGTVKQPRVKTGRGMLIAGGVLTGLGVVGRIGLEVFWSTAAQIVPTDPFARWSTPNVVFVTNWNNLMFFGPGLGLLTAGAYRRGGYEAGLGKARDAGRMRKVGIGMLAGGLGLWALSRALFLPIAEACPSNRCAYTTLETTFWIGAGAIFAGAAHLAYTTGYSKAHAKAHAKAKISVAPSFGPGLAGLGLAGRF